MHRFHGLSIKGKLIAIITATSTVALFLACSGFVLHELLSFRGSLTRELTTLAEIVSQSSTAALQFDDARTARETLAVLRAQPHIRCGAIYGERDALFAKYVRANDGDDVPAGPGAEGTHFTARHFVLCRPILIDGERAGMVYLKSDLREMYARLVRYGWIAGAVLLASCLVAFLVSFVVQTVISKPILHLADTAGLVSSQQNYSIRAVQTTDDELGVLVCRFNEMMEQIHARDLALEQAQEELEDRVERRTSELQIEIRERQRVEASLLTAKQAAEESNRAKSVFLANMSHELRTPLNAVIGYGEMLEEEALDCGDARTAADLRRIQTAGRDLLALLNGLLDLSKIEAGKMEAHMEQVPLGPAVTELVTMIEAVAHKNGNRLVVGPGCMEGTMCVDAVKFRQSLLNLLSNACKFTRNGTITLDALREERDGREWIDWHVRDTGIGIAAEEMKKLFLPFSQVDSSATREYGGTGLGLAISQRFCQLMGGGITVTSEPGRGSTFSMRLPAGAAERGSMNADGPDDRNEATCDAHSAQG